MAGNSSIPVVTIDLSSRPSLHEPRSDIGTSHTDARADAASTHQLGSFLSPYPSPPIGRLSLDVPRSLSPSPTVVSSFEGSSVGVSPSPTLSTQSSLQSATSLHLRNNKPEERSGLTSLDLLSHAILDTDRRKRSIITLSSNDGHSSLDETEPDHGDGAPFLHRARSDTTSLTVTSPSAHFEFRSREFMHRESEVLHPPVNIPLELRSSSAPDGGHAAGTPVAMPLHDEDIDLGSLAFEPYKLASLLDPKGLHSLEAIRGVESLLRGLGTDPTQGLWIGTHDSQRHAEPSATKQGALESKGVSSIACPGNDNGDKGDSFRASPQTKSLLILVWLALKEKVLVLLSIVAVISLALGLFQDFGTSREPGDLPVDWVEGVAIMITILLVKERQFKAQREERGIRVIRNGVEHIIDVKEVVVGDIALLQPGEIIPCDRIFLSGHNVKCDEFAATGETHAIKKAPDLYCIERKQMRSPQKENPSTDYLIVSGNKVLDGVGRYVVAVGMKSFNGRIMMAVHTDTENTPFQLKLNILAEFIAKVGRVAGIVHFTALMIRFFVQLETGNLQWNQNGMAFVQILIMSVTLVVVAVPESLPHISAFRTDAEISKGNVGRECELQTWTSLEDVFGSSSTAHNALGGTVYEVMVGSGEQSIKQPNNPTSGDLLPLPIDAADQPEGEEKLSKGIIPTIVSTPSIPHRMLEDNFHTIPEGSSASSPPSDHPDQSPMSVATTPSILPTSKPVKPGIADDKATTVLSVIETLAERASRYSMNLHDRVERDVSKFATGGYAVVYQGTLRPQGAMVAIKTFRFGHKSDISIIKGIFHEVYLWSKLCHENIVPLIGITTKFDQTVSMISPWMGRGNAHDYVQNRGVDPRPLLVGVANGLHYLHSHGESPIYHGDLKGLNILLSDEGHALLTDFGFSQAVQSSFSMTVPSHLGGSVNWMPPEYIDEIEECAITAEGDVWSFGMTALELFTGSPPFHNVKNQLNVRLRILRGPPERPSEVDTCSRLTNEWWNICNACWNRNPLARPKMSDILLQLAIHGSEIN